MKKTLLTKFDRLMAAVAFAEENEPEMAVELLNEDKDQAVTTINRIDLNSVPTTQISQ